MATYIKDPAVSGGKLSSESYYKYGSNMLGAWNKVRDVETALPVIEGKLERGQQELYLPNQLGNNMVIINDRKIQNDTNGDGIIDSYDAVVLKAADYSAFGDNLIGREFNGNKIKYGFNGKWNDVETGYQDYGFRMYSTKARRFNSVDPLTSKYPMLTPYQFASNNPVWMLDLDGLEGFKFSDVWNNRATLFDFIQNPDVTGTVGEFNRSFNPLFILNNYGVKLRTGHDYDGNPIDSRGKAGVIADLGVEAMQWMTIGKLFGSVPKATTAMEQEMTQASKAMGKIEATPKQAIAEEVTSTSSQQTVTQPIKSKFLGGAKGKLYSKWQILEANHAPTMQSFKLAGFDIPYNTGSAFQMLYKEHQLFVSSGPGKLAQAFRNQEANLLKEGKFLEAFDLTANKVNFKYGDKYKEAIGEAREYFQKEVVPRLEKQFKEKK